LNFSSYFILIIVQSSKVCLSQNFYVNIGLTISAGVCGRFGGLKAAFCAILSEARLPPMDDPPLILSRFYWDPSVADWNAPVFYEKFTPFIGTC
jgi:hypothetical protein